MDFKQADKQLQGRYAERRKIANNTYLERRGQDIAVRLHSTDVLTYHPDGSVTLNSDSWRTVTTKQRMNEYLPDGWRVSQERGQWYIGNTRQTWKCATCGVVKMGSTPAPYCETCPPIKVQGGEIPRQMQANDWNWKMVLFENGIVLRPDGTFEGGSPLADEKAALKLRRRASNYAKAFIKAMRASEVPAPGLDDYLFCDHKIISPDEHKGKTLNETYPTPADHLLLHIEEKYFVPSLLARALEVMPSSMAMKWAVGEVWSAPRTPEGHLIEKLQKGWASEDFV